MVRFWGRERYGDLGERSLGGCEKCIAEMGDDRWSKSEKNEKLVPEQRSRCAMVIWAEIQRQRQIFSASHQHGKAIGQ